MGFAALYSGGKDSSLALWKAQNRGVNVDYLITVKPERDDSYMFHKPNLQFVPKLSKALGIDLIEVTTEGEKEKELDDLRKGIDSLDIDGLITGAVASNYQMKRIKSLCKEKDLELFAPLWKMDQTELVEELIKNDFKVIIVSVAAMGLDERWLGRNIDEDCLKDLKDLHKKYRINIAGEGGEYETFVLDAPNHRWGYAVIDAEIKWDGQRGEYNIIGLEKVF